MNFLTLVWYRDMSKSVYLSFIYLSIYLSNLSAYLPTIYLLIHPSICENGGLVSVENGNIPWMHSNHICKFTLKSQNCLHGIQET
jgi:hypothetical protein